MEAGRDTNRSKGMGPDPAPTDEPGERMGPHLAPAHEPGERMGPDPAPTHEPGTCMGPDPPRPRPTAGQQGRGSYGRRSGTAFFAGFLVPEPDPPFVLDPPSDEPPPDEPTVPDPEAAPVPGVPEANGRIPVNPGPRMRVRLGALRVGSSMRLAPPTRVVASVLASARRPT